MEYGIQLYGVRDIAKDDLEKALRGVAELGYTGVEFAGFFGHDAAEVKGWLTQYGLHASGTHTGWREIAEHFDETVAYHKAIGCDLITVPSADLSTREKLSEFIDVVNGLAPRLAAEGMRFAYHNHDHEFKPNEDGQIIYDELVEHATLQLQLDTYWAYVAGKDPIALMESLASRLAAIHIKDGLADRTGKPLGMGTAPVGDVYQAARRLGVPMIVESETQQPDGMTEAKICIEYLRSLEV
jgi:sugar phosphate isomerase/epimerase